MLNNISVQILHQHIQIYKCNKELNIEIMAEIDQGVR